MNETVTLTRTNGRLTAAFSNAGRAMTVCAELPPIDCRPGSRDLSRKQPLAKALGKAETVIDATAGLAQDAMFMACLGYRVTALERCGILVQLVEDLLTSLDSENACASLISAHLKLIHGDAISDLSTMQPADVVYLDPMFPPRRHESALPRKEIQLIRAVAGDDLDSDRLFGAAMSTAGKRVVVKRPHYARPLGENVHHSIESKLLRYDVYVK